MVKQYTSLEMRYMANAIRGQYGDNSEFTDAIAMLRQAADLMAREEKREKRYEYSIKAPNGNIEKCHEDEMFPIMPIVCKVVRREVGEWEEVSNG